MYNFVVGLIMSDIGRLNLANFLNTDKKNTR